MQDDSPLSEAFDYLVHELADLAPAWVGERAALQWPVGDACHHLAQALFRLEDVTRDPSLLAPHAAYELMEDDLRVLAREAFLSVLAIGQLLHRALDDRLAPPGALEGPELAVWRMLEELTPYVSRADGGLRRTLLDGVPLEIVLADLERRA